MKKYTFALILLVLNFSILTAQTNLENLLQDIEQNNLELKSLSEKQKAQEYEAKAILQLDNPHFGGEYLVNSPTSAEKYGFELTQSFAFPTVYGKQKQLVGEQINYFNLEYQQSRREMLFQAASVIMEIIYNNKLQLLLVKKENSTKLAYEKYQTLFDEKSATILDLSKAKLEYFNAKTLLKRQIINHVNLNNNLKQLNGSIEIVLQDTIFPTLTKVSDYIPLKNDYIQNEIELRKTEQNILISKKKMQLAKNERLPKLDLGYKYANEENLQFNGLVFGFSIPLWQGKKEVKASQANLKASEIEFQYEQEKAESEIYILYNNYLLQKSLYEEYQTVFADLNILESLNKQFELRSLTSSEYYLQLNDYYNLQMEFQLAEYNFSKAYLALIKYKF